MANPFMFLAPLNGSLAFQDRAGGGTLTGSGAVRYAAASGARWNLWPDPYMSAGSIYFTGQECTVADVSAPSALSAIGLPTAMKITATSGASAAGYFGAYQSYSITYANRGAPVASLTQYTISAKLYNASAIDYNVQVTIDNRSANMVTSFGNMVQSVVACPAGQVTSFSYTGTTAEAVQSLGLSFYVLDSGPDLATGTELYVSGVQIEAGATANTLIAGSNGGVCVDPRTGLLGSIGTCPTVSQAAAWVEEGTTNLFTNPNADSVVTGDTATGSCTVNRSTSVQYRGGASFRAITTGTSTGEGHLFTVSGFSSMSARTFIGQAKVKQLVTGGLLMIRLDAVYSDASRTVGTTINFTATTAWEQRVSAAVTTDPAKTLNNLQLFVVTRASAQVVTIHVGDVQIEEKAYATSFTSGEIGTGYAWSGTAHASSSTRTATTISVSETNRINSTRGSFVGRVSFLQSLIAAAGVPTVFMAGTWAGASKDEIGMRLASSKFNLILTSNGTAAAAAVVDTGSLAVSTWYAPYADWNGTVINLAGSSSTLVAGTRAATSGDISGDDLFIGSAGTTLGAGQIAGLINNVAIFDRPLTAKERATIYARSTLAWGTLRGGRVGLLMPI